MYSPEKVCHIFALRSKQFTQYYMRSREMLLITLFHPVIYAIYITLFPSSIVSKKCVAYQYVSDTKILGKCSTIFLLLFQVFMNNFVGYIIMARKKQPDKHE